MDSYDGVSVWQKHVGRHQQDDSLAALPMLDTTSEDGDSDPDNDDKNIGHEDHEIITEDDSPTMNPSHDSRKDEDLIEFPGDPYSELNDTVERSEVPAYLGLLKNTAHPKLLTLALLKTKQWRVSNSPW